VDRKAVALILDQNAWCDFCDFTKDISEFGRNDVSGLGKFG